MANLFAPIALGTIAAGIGGFVIQGEDSGDAAGTTVTVVGDMNGDGFDEILIGAFTADAAGNKKSEAGAGYIVFGAAGGFGASIDLARIARGEGGFVIQGEDGGGPGSGDLTAVYSGAAGDVNGDGFADVVLGAPRADGAGNAKPNAGAAYVVFGRAATFPAQIDLADVAQGQGGFVIFGAQAFDYAGQCASAGDVNGDGFGDVIVGAIRAGSGGNAYVVFGNAGGFPSGVNLAQVEAGNGGFVIRGDDGGGFTGRSVALAGDVNGDGFTDLLIGNDLAPGPNDTRPSAGAAYVVFGKAGGFAGNVALSDVANGVGGFVIRGARAGEYAGFRTSGAGDVNGDGIDDLIIATRGGNAAYVVFGSAGGFGAEVDLAQVARGQGGFVIQAAVNGVRQGDAVAGAGDLNGDGFDDLLVGGYSSNNAHVIFGKAGGFGASVLLTDIAKGIGGFVMKGEDPGDAAGVSVSVAGDVNGDGFDDLVAGAWQADAAGNQKPSAGAAYVVFGGAFQPGQAGTEGNDSLVGAGADEALTGLAGRDTLRGAGGADTLIGGDNRDRLFGGEGADVLSGGGGADRFAFNALALDGVDRILDFDRDAGDLIVLRRIDSVLATADNDAFTVIGTAAFTLTAGELRWSDLGRGVQRIEGDIDGDGVADLRIDVVDAAPIAADWFVL